MIVFDEDSDNKDEFESKDVYILLVHLISIFIKPNYPTVYKLLEGHG